MKSGFSDLFRSCQEFEWDAGNQEKIRQKHGLRPPDIETVFLDPQLKIFSDIKHSDREDRYIVLGKSQRHQLLFVCLYNSANADSRDFSAPGKERKGGHAL